MIMLAVTATCVFVEPTSGIIVGILLSLGKGAFLESKAWVLCKLRQGDAVVAQFNCDLVPSARSAVSSRAELRHEVFAPLSLALSLLTLASAFTPRKPFSSAISRPGALLDKATAGG
jgi:hypothetical protein